jgi:hypothetical protein
MRKLTIAFLLLAANSALADEHPLRHGVLRTGFYLDPMWSYIKADRVRATGNGQGGTVSLGYLAGNGLAALEAGGFYTKLSRVGDPALSSGKLEGALIDGVVFPFSQLDFEPTHNLYALLGIGVQTQKIRSTTYEAGAGFLAPIRVSERYSFGVRVEARYRVENQEPPTQRPADGPPVTPPNQEPPPPQGQPTVQYHDWVLSLGLHIPLSPEPRSESPSPPAPIEVVPP